MAAPSSLVLVLSVSLIAMCALLAYAYGFLFGAPKRHSTLYDAVKTVSEKQAQTDKDSAWMEFCDSDDYDDDMKKLMEEVRSGEYYESFFGTLVKQVQGEITNVPFCPSSTTI